MTKQRTYYARCPKCDAYPAYCKDCGSRTTGSTPFSDYLRGLKDDLSSKFFDSENLDYIWFQYREGWLITIEEKMWGKTGTRAQRDTHNIVAQLLALGARSRCLIKTMRGDRRIEYRGHYEISFQNTNPTDSDWFKINGILIKDTSKVFNLLRTGKIAGIPNGINLPNQK